ncbi:hypothetical protein N9194_01720, partial [bacterium]|nr:hypothetical protein [bacterium]
MEKLCGKAIDAESFESGFAHAVIIGLVALVIEGVSDGSNGFYFAFEDRKATRDEAAHGSSGSGLFGQLRVIHPLLDFEAEGELVLALRDCFVNVGGHSTESLAA